MSGATDSVTWRQAGLAGSHAARYAHRMDIYERIAALPADEQRLVEACISRVLDRLDAGRAQYGPWSITRDRRLDIDHYREATEELTDGLVYLAMSALVRGA